MKGVVKLQMFGLPNFIRIEGLSDDNNALDVGALFPSDDEARHFWQDGEKKWLEHVAKRRQALSAGESNG